MLFWDGTDITDIIKKPETILEEGIYEKTTIWRISIGEEYEYCLVRQSLNLLPCLIDELKGIFQISKIGTHWVKYKGKKFILLKLSFKNGTVYFDLTLDQIKFRKDLAWEVQKIFVFRELLGVTRSWEKSVILRIDGNFVKPISFYEPGMAPTGEGKVIPDTVIHKWFLDISLDEGVKKILGVSESKDIVNKIHELRGKMEKVVERVDRDLISFVDEILKRISSRLQFILN